MESDKVNFIHHHLHITVHASYPICFVELIFMDANLTKDLHTAAVYVSTFAWYLSLTNHSIELT